MNANDKYNQFIKNHRNDDQDDFFENLAKEFNVSVGTAYNIWYAPQRSWYKPEMMDEIIRLDKVGAEQFHPCFASGEFKWDGNKFIPAN